MPIKYVLTFVLGAGVGGAVGYFATKKYFENYLNEEIDSVKDYYKSKAEKQENEPKTDKNDQKTDENEPNYKEMIEKLNYSGFSEKKKETPSEDTVPDNRPFVISVDDYIGDQKYQKLGMTYFEKDGVFCDEDEQVVPDGMDLIGEHNLDKFGEYEEDTLFVRNVEQGCDYEVVLDDGAYADSLYEGYEDD